MAKHLSQIEVELDNPIDVHVSGEVEEHKIVVLTAPTSASSAEASKIKNFCGALLRKNSENSKAEKEKSGKDFTEVSKKDSAESKKRFTGDDLNVIMSMQDLDNPEDLESMYNMFQRMLGRGCGKIGGENISPTLFAELSFADMEKLFGEYAVNFLLASLVN